MAVGEEAGAKVEGKMEAKMAAAMVAKDMCHTSLHSWLSSNRDRHRMVCCSRFRQQKHCSIQSTMYHTHRKSCYKAEVRAVTVAVVAAEEAVPSYVRER